MRVAKLFALALLLALGLMVLAALQPVDTDPKPAGAAAPAFDHSNCQYPDRWSNPADGCDNSDPAVPECLKAAYSQEAEAECIAAFVAEHEAPKQPEPAVETKPNEPAADPAVCGGK